MRFLAALWAALLLPATIASATAHASPGECATCHPRARVLWSDGVHAKEGIPCIGCHLGNAEATDADTGHRAMRRFEHGGEIAETCGGCHRQAPLMQPYNLATDQLALYRESAHGRSRLAGNGPAPVCTDCHQNHYVLSATDPASPAFPANLTETCGGCHADETLAEEHDLDPGVIHSFAQSPHGRALLEPLTRRGPSCANCHDAHGAAIPRNANVDEICGGCHAATRARLRSGSHRGLLLREDLAGCASCHPLHNGQRAAALDQICSNCHAEGSSQIALGSELAKLRRDAREEVARAKQAVLRAQRIPLAVRDHEGVVSEAHGYLMEAGTELHGFQREPVEDLTRAASSMALGVQREIELSLEHKSAGLALVAVWLYTAITLAILSHLRRRAVRRGPP